MVVIVNEKLVKTESVVLEVYYQLTGAVVIKSAEGGFVKEAASG